MGVSSDRAGLHDVHGNVWEWTVDFWNESYAGALSDTSVWKTGDCSRRIIRGGLWNVVPRGMLSADRGRNGSVARVSP